jgi:short-subunit dehydrogenase
MKAIIIDASSGIGRELTKILSHKGYEIGIIARREDLLVSLKDEIYSPGFIKPADISYPEEATLLLQTLIKEMGR